MTPTDLTLSILSTSATIIFTIAALAWSRAAVTATRTSRQLARIEIERRHSKLVPKFELEAGLDRPTGLVWFTFKFDGLDRIDKRTISVLNTHGRDNDGRAGSDGEESKEFGRWLEREPREAVGARPPYIDTNMVRHSEAPVEEGVDC